MFNEKKSEIKMVEIFALLTFFTWLVFNEKKEGKL